MREKAYWPLYIAAQALDTPNIKIAVGDPFRVQTREYVRSLAPAYGVENVDELAFTELPYLRVINVAESSRPPARV